MGLVFRIWTLVQTKSDIYWLSCTLPRKPAKLRDYIWKDCFAEAIWDIKAMDLTHRINLVPGARLVHGKVPQYTAEKRAFEKGPSASSRAPCESLNIPTCAPPPGPSASSEPSEGLDIGTPLPPPGPSTSSLMPICPQGQAESINSGDNFNWSMFTPKGAASTHFQFSNLVFGPLLQTNKELLYKCTMKRK